MAIIHYCIANQAICNQIRFLGSGPKGPMSCRTQGGISRRPSFRPSVLPSFRPSFRPSPPGWPSRPHILTLRPDLGPLSPQISPFLGSGPKGPMSCRTQGGISIRPSVRPSVLPSVRPPPNDHQGPKPALSGLFFALQSSNLPS